MTTLTADDIAALRLAEDTLLDAWGHHPADSPDGLRYDRARAQLHRLANRAETEADLTGDRRHAVEVARSVATIDGHDQVPAVRILQGGTVLTSQLRELAQLCRTRDTRACRDAARILDQWAGSGVAA